MNESMVIIIEGVSDHSMEMQRDGKGGEMNVMGYKTQNFHICPSATTAFSELVNRGFRGDQAEMLSQIAMLVDDYLGIEVMAMQQGGTDMANTRKMIDMGNSAFYNLGAFAMEAGDETIMSLFDFMPDHILKVVEVSTEEIMDDEDCGCPKYAMGGMTDDKSDPFGGSSKSQKEKEFLEILKEKKKKGIGYSGGVRNPNNPNEMGILWEDGTFFLERILKKGDPRYVK